MNKKIKMITAVLLLNTLLLCPGCSLSINRGESSQPKISFENGAPRFEKKVKLTVGVPGNDMVTDFKDNSYTRALEEKLNAELEFQIFEKNEDGQEQLDLYVNEGGEKLPDILVGFDLDDITIDDYAKKGAIIPLDEYYEKDAYFLKKVMEKEPKLKEMITMSDGRIYVIPRYIKSVQNEYMTRMWIEESWLDKLGLKIPQTTEEYRDVLRAFKENDCNGNGKKDEIPLSGWQTNTSIMFIDFLMSSFVYTNSQDNYLYMDDGKVKASYVQDEWKEGVLYIKSLVDEGLLSADSLTQTSQQFKNIFRDVDDNVIGSFVSTAPPLKDGKRKDDTSGYIVIPPLEGPGGKRTSVYTQARPANAFVITKNCKYPEAAFILGDLMCSEEMTIWDRWGEKGKDWVEPGTLEKGLFSNIGYPALISPVTVWGYPSNSNWHSMAAGYRDYNISMGQTASKANKSETAIAAAFPDYLYYKSDEHMRYIKYTGEDNKAIQGMLGALTNAVNTSLVEFITGKRDINEEWEIYKQSLYDIGLDDCIGYVQSAYDRTYGIQE